MGKTYFLLQELGIITILIYNVEVELLYVIIGRALNWRCQSSMLPKHIQVHS